MATNPMMECIDPEAFSAGPDCLEPGEERRHEALWQYALGKSAGDGQALARHVEHCRACASLVESFRRLDAGLRARATVFAACPSARDLSDYHYCEMEAERREKVAAHLEDCSYCREDLAWLGQTAESKVVTMPGRRWTGRWAIIGAVAAAFLLAAIGGLRYLRPPSYADLAQVPSIDRGELAVTLDRPEKFRRVLEDSLNAYDAGDYVSAEAKLKPILDAFPSDPSALYVEALAEFKRGNGVAAEKLMEQSERTQPMSAYRCWGALQLALATGSRAGIDRECKHLAGHPVYSERVRGIQDGVRRRGA